jgi:hypothetical protein
MAEPRAQALLALWNDVDPALDALYNEWHANEHVPERLTVPGMLWGRRYGRADAAAVAGGMRYLTLYGLSAAQVLDEEPYRRLLREPTPASARMRPALQNISRWVCALHIEADLDRGTHLALWVSDGEPSGDSEARRCRVQHHDAVGLLVASRIPDEAPLPWVQIGQGRAIEGEWIEALSFDLRQRPELAALTGMTIYERLPVG